MPSVFMQTAILAALITLTVENKLEREPNLDHNRRFSSIDAFKNYKKKFDPVVVLDKIDIEQKKRGKNFTREEYFDMVFNGIDITEDILKLKVQNGNPKILGERSGRKLWMPPRGLSVYPKDAFSYKPRLYELMKQAIYQARNKMIIMQLLREKYHDKPMFKMGYLTSKTDTACKTFFKVTIHAMRHCLRVINTYWDTFEGPKYYRFYLYDIMVTHMRILHLWFQANLLTELLLKNDVAYHGAYEYMLQWNFTN